ncbi:MAG: ABC transporter ATP-binding protein [Akkermansiaceae bacterium]|nr:ABC transporter ATP-binding protein [Akkermansiaceae bacterium]
MTDALLQISALEKRYPTKWGGPVLALCGIDLTLRRGDFLALRGPSGCGKTTLLHCVGALLRPDGGKVLIDGIDPYALGSSARSAFRAAKVGFVFQNFHLVPYLSVLDNVMLCALAGGPRSHLETQARDLLEKFRLSHRLRHRPSELSVGEQQRVALVRAVAGGAKLILADEPTGNLDAENGGILLDQLAAFAADGGAVLMVTHDPAASDRAGHRRNMQDGRLTAATNDSDAN